MTKKRAAVVVLLALTAWILLWGLGNVEENLVLVDPFADGTRETFEEIGMPVIALYDSDYSVKHNSNFRTIVVRIDPELCPEASPGCVKGILEAQPWIIDLELSNVERIPLQFDIRDGGKRCGAAGGPLQDSTRGYPQREISEQLPDDWTGLWAFSFECPGKGEFPRSPGDNR